jgi:acyl-CoA thioesterase I
VQSRSLGRVLVALAVVIQASGCSSGGSKPASDSTGSGVSAGATVGAATTGATGASGAAGATSTAGTTSATGATAETGTTSATGGTGTTSASGSTSAAGASGSFDASGGSGSDSDSSVDTDTGTGVAAFPSTQTVKIMVVGSSNELITCWRAFLWRELEAANIKNFDFVGGVTSGPDCGVPGYDMDLQAQSGIIVSNLPASTYAGWFKAHPPDVILMHFGGADLLANMPIAGVMNAYSLALAQARIVNPQVRFFIAQHTPEDETGCTNCKVTVVELNADIVTWATQNTTAQSPVTSVDLYTGIDPATDESDGVHLNNAGSQIVADRWFAAIGPLFKP